MTRLDAVSAEGSLPSRKDCLTFKIGSADRQISALLTEFLLFEVLGSMDIGIDGRGQIGVSEYGLNNFNVHPGFAQPSSKRVSQYMAGEWRKE